MNSVSGTRGSGYVYLVTHKNAKGLWKIGLTRSPEERMKQLGGDDLTVRAMVMAVDPEEVERSLHKEFSEVRLPQSEWFALDDNHLRWCIFTLKDAHELATKYVVHPDIFIHDLLDPRLNDEIEKPGTEHIEVTVEDDTYFKDKKAEEPRILSAYLQLHEELKRKNMKQGSN